MNDLGLIGITGGSGVLGSYLIDTLRLRNFKSIRIIDSKAPSGKNASVPVEYVQGDVCQVDSITQALQGCSTCFHLAALVDATLSFEKPLEYIKINVQGTATVLEACRRAGVKHIVVVSTVHVYGPPQKSPFIETSPCHPQSPYAASKLAAEQVALAFAASYGLSVCIARISNLYGSRFSGASVIGRALTMAAQGKTIALKTLAPIRDFIHAPDAATALIELASLSTHAGDPVYNVSSGASCSIKSIADAVADAAFRLGMPRPVICAKNTTVDNSDCVKIDNAKLCTATLWQPQDTVQTGIFKSFQELLTLHPQREL